MSVHHTWGQAERGRGSVQRHCVAQVELCVACATTSSHCHLPALLTVKQQTTITVDLGVGSSSWSLHFGNKHYLPHFTLFRSFSWFPTIAILVFHMLLALKVYSCCQKVVVWSLNPPVGLLKSPWSKQIVAYLQRWFENSLILMYKIFNNQNLTGGNCNKF